MAFALDLPGSANHYASTQDGASLDITGDIDVRIKLAMDDWTPSSEQRPITKWSGGDPAWMLRVLATGVLRFNWNDGTTRTADSTIATGVTDGVVKWLRVTLDVDNGAAGNSVMFFTSDDGVIWSQLGTTVTQAFTTSIRNSAQALQIGRDSDGTGNVAGLVYYAELRSGIGGTVVASPDFDRNPARPQGMLLTGMGGTNSFFDAQSLNWTVSGGNSKFVAV